MGSSLNYAMSIVLLAKEEIVQNQQNCYKQENVNEAFPAAPD
jgi:hypothetical protein